MNRQATLHFDRGLLRVVSLRYLVRTLGKGTLLLYAGLVLVTTYLLVNAKHDFQLGLLVGMCGTLSLALCFVILIAWNQAATALRMMREPAATCEQLPDRLNHRSELGETELPYASFRQLIRFPEAWLLEMAQGRYVTLPSHDLDQDFRRELERRLKEAGVRLN